MGTEHNEPLLWAVIDARPISFPACVQEMNVVMLDYSVPAEAARALLPAEGFELVEHTAGTGHVSLTAHEVRRGDWGPATGFAVTVRVRPTGAPDDEIGVLACPSPINKQVVREVAHRSTGMVGSLEPVDVHYTEETVTFTLGDGDQPTATLRFPRVRAGSLMPGVRLLSYVDLGKPHVVPFDMDVPSGYVDRQKVELELGSGSFADMLRDLGLPKMPDISLWGEGLGCTWHTPQPLKTPTRLRVVESSAEDPEDPAGR